MSKILNKKKISELVEVYNQIRVPLSSKVRESLKKIYPYFGAQGVVDYVDRYLFDGEYILVAEDGENLRSNNQDICNIVYGKFWVNNHAHILSANSNNITKYLFYNFNRIKFEPYVTGSAQPKLNKENLLNIETFVHSISEQRQIVTVLSALDDKIELNKKINVELEQMAKTLYDYWFVQFDFPFDFAQGKPDAEGKPYKSSGGKMVYNEVLKREIPEGWEVGKLNDIATLNPSLSIKKNSISPYIEMSSIPTSGYMTRKPEKKEFGGGVKFQNGDIIVARITPCLENGKTALISLLEENEIGFGSTEFINIRCKHRDFKSFLAILSRSDSFRGYAISKMTGTSGRKRVDAKDLSNFVLVIPQGKVVRDFESIVGAFFDKMTFNTKQSQQLSTLRDWLLPMLMNGQVSVTEMDSTSEAVLKSSQYETNDIHSIAAEPETTYGRVVPLNIPDKKKGFAKQVLAGKIVSEFKDDPHFTNIKFQKIQFMAEHIIEADINLNYYYQTAGPYDNAFMKAIYGHFRNQKWFSTRDKRFVPLENHKKIEGYYQGYFGPAKDRLGRLFELLHPKTESESEIIATLYAVWNNRIIEGRSSIEEDLYRDFYQWSDRKRDYTEEQLFIALKWLKDHEMEPRGFGNLIKKPKQK